MRLRELAVGVACLATVGCQSESALTEVSSDTSREPAAMCGRASPFDEFLRDWSCDTLKAAKEPQLPVTPQSSRATYRIMWAPSFEPSVIVRIEDDMTGQGKMSVSIVHAQATEKPMKLLSRQTFSLSRAELAEFHDLISQSGFWYLPISADRSENLAKGGKLECLDGTMLILEAQDDNRYHLSVAHCSPFEGAKKVAAGTLRLATSRVKELEQFQELTRH